MNENNNGKGLFYGVVGVATLIVAIIGATFAYFTVNATLDNTQADDIGGEAANFGEGTVTYTITKVTDGTQALIPLGSAAVGTATDQRSAALNADEMCYDVNGNKVCDVYKVVLTNNSTTASAVLSGTFTLTAADTDNFMWSSYEATGDATLVPASLASATANTKATTTLETNQTLTAGSSNTYFIMVWLNDIGTQQNDDMAKEYSGTLAFNSGEGNKIVAQF